MRIRETELTDEVLSVLISMSEDWEKENNTYGYRRNTKEDIEGNRIFLAEEDGKCIGYLFGHLRHSENMKAVMPENTPYFEIEELYVIPSCRSRGAGRSLLDYVSKEASAEAEYILLSTASKNRKAILHFYIEEAGMELWSARLFKKIR